MEVGHAAKTTLVTGAVVSGTVIARSTALDPATGLGTVRIAMNDAPADVPIGAFGRTVITGAVHADVLTFPASTLRGAVADGAEVVVCADGKALVRSVEVGWRGADRVELRGVAPGERVASDHVLGLESGQLIVESP